MRVCRGSEDGSYVIGLLYPFLLTGEFCFESNLFVLVERSSFARSGVHVLRGEDEKVPGGVQRDPMHRVRQLRDDRALAGVRAPLHGLEQQRRQSHHPGALSVDERAGAAALPVSAQGLSGAGQAGEEHEEAGDGQTGGGWLLPADHARHHHASHARANVHVALIPRLLQTVHRPLFPSIRPNFSLTRRCSFFLSLLSRGTLLSPPPCPPRRGTKRNRDEVNETACRVYFVCTKPQTVEEERKEKQKMP